MVQFKVSQNMIPLVYEESKKQEKPNSSASSSSSTSAPDSKSAISSGPKTPVMSPDAKKRLEEQRTELFAEMEEYKAKLGLIGVTVKEYGPAVMRLLGFLLNRKDRNKTQHKNKEKKASSSEEKTKSSTTEENDSATSSSTKEKTIEGGKPKKGGDSSFTTKSEIDIDQQKVPKKKLSTRRFDKLFGEKKLTSQSNDKQQRDALVLYSLFKKLNISQNCIDGSKLKADIREKEHKPNRYIFLFFKTIKSKQYVVGFVSGTKTEEKSPQDGSTAIIDYVCPRLDQPPDDNTKWRNTEELGNLVAFCLLKMLWLNDDKGHKKYASVSYKNHPYKTSKDVFARLDRVKIDPYARQTMGFKKSSASASVSEEGEE